MSAGLILLHAWWGLNDDVRERAEKLRAEGYTVATPDLLGGRVASTIDEAKALTAHETENEERITRMVDDAVSDLSTQDLGFARAIEREMNAAGGDVRVELYPGTSHWFDEPSRPEYDAAASALAWDRTQAFLRAHLGS